jgi:hypothetical protein
MAFALKTTKKVVAKPAPAAKKAIKKVGVAVKSTKATRDMTPLEKARAARAAGGGVKKKATAKPARKPLPTFDAPADFKSHFLEVSLRTEKDGLLASQIKATRYQGRFDPNAEDKKKADLGGYDWATLIGIQARFAAVTFKATNDKKYPAEVKGRTEVKGAMRLPANTSFKILLRVNRKAADGTISVLIKNIQQGVKNAKGRITAIDLDKKDPVYRAFRKAGRILPAAFKAVLMPPKRTRGKKDEADDE